ncbi:MAG: galactokinase [Candidatus Azotimanducaceae bacterium]
MKEFFETFGIAPEFCVFAPARVNLIGEHIDYCGGNVLPMAISQGTHIWGAYNDSRVLRFHSARFDQSFAIDLDQTLRSGHDWQQYVVGVLSLLKLDDWAPSVMRGGDFYITQNAGSAGLSSSASFCAALVIALGKFEEADQATRTRLAQLCRRVEHEYAGVDCGIMDQMSVLMGHVIRLNCASLEFERVRVDFSNALIVVMDTGAQRTLAGSGYNRRVSELAEIASIKGLDGYLELATLDVPTAGLSAVLRRRLLHVQSEHARVGQSHQALVAGDWETLGQLMIESHLSLRDDYEVSCEPLDTMVSLATAHPGVFGARMTGGGFGGCAVCIVQRDAASEMIEAVSTQYEKSVQLTPKLFIAEAAGPAGFVPI